MGDEAKRPDLQALHTYFARASDCSHRDLRTIGELLEYAGRLEAERDNARRFARAWKQKAKAEREQRKEWQWDYGEAE